MTYKSYSCVNSRCEMHNKYGQGNIKLHRRYGKDKDREILYCNVCITRFSSERNTIFEKTRLPKKVVYSILENLCSGCGVRGTARNVGVHRDTVTKIKRFAAEHFEQVNEILLQDLEVTEIQMDEFWSFVKKKEKRASEEEKVKELAGDRYTYVAMDAVSRLVISVASGRREQHTANRMLEVLKQRICLVFSGAYRKILFTTDSWDQYLKGLKTVFGQKHTPRRQNKRGRKKKARLYLPWYILYATVEKIKNGSNRVIRVVRNVTWGSRNLVEKIISDSPVSNTINTSFIERLNGTYRAFCSRLTRKSYKFSKVPQLHDAHISIVTAYYNFIKPHCSLSKISKKPVTPSMAAGITYSCWNWEDLCRFNKFNS